MISAFNSLTLSPALSAILLKPHGAPPDRLTRLLNRGLGWLFRPFNRLFARGSDGYGRAVGRVLRRRGAALAVYAGLVALTVVLFSRVPSGFVPTQDKQYLVAFAQLPDGATLDRTEAVIREMSDIGLKHPGVASAVQFPGLSINGFVNLPNAGIVFFTLKPFDERKSDEEYGLTIAGALNGEVRRDPGCLRRRLPASARCRAWARWADSRWSWRTGPVWVRRSFTTPAQALIGKGVSDARSSPASSPGSRSTSRSSRWTWTGRR